MELRDEGEQLGQRIYSAHLQGLAPDGRKCGNSGIEGDRIWPLALDASTAWIGNSCRRRASTRTARRSRSICPISHAINHGNRIERVGMRHVDSIRSDETHSVRILSI